MGARNPLLACAVLLWASVLSHGAPDEGASRLEPSVEVRQHLPAEIDPGAMFSVEISVRNVGPIAVDDVTLSSTLPPGFEIVSAEPRVQRGEKPVWNAGRLRAGEEFTLSLRVRLKPEATETHLSSVVDVSFRGSARSVAEARVRRPILALSVRGPATANLGETVSFRVTVQNKGNDSARDVNLLSVLPVGLVHAQGADLEGPLGNIKAGESRTVDLEVKAKRSGDMNVRVRLQARGLATIEQTALCRVEEELVTVSATPAAAAILNRTTLHELVIANDGPRPATKVELVLALPKEIDFIRATDRGEFDPKARTLRWDLGDIAAGTKQVVVWNGIARIAGDWPCVLRLRADGKELREVRTTLSAVSREFASEPRDPR